MRAHLARRRPSRRGMMRDATRWLTACPSRGGAVASLRSTASVRQPARPDLGNAPASSMRGAIPHTRAWACRASSLQRSRPLCRLCGTLRRHTRTVGHRRCKRPPPPRALRPGSVWAASAVGSDSLPDPTAGGTVPAAAAWRGPAGPRAPPPPPADALAPPLAGAPHVRPRRPPMLAAARARRAGAGSRRVVWSPARCPRHRRVAVSVGGRARRHSAPRRGGGKRLCRLVPWFNPVHCHTGEPRRRRLPAAAATLAGYRGGPWPLRTAVRGGQAGGQPPVPRPGAGGDGPPALVQYVRR